jgi:hypothetical protein
MPDTQLCVWQVVLSKLIFFRNLLFLWGGHICLYPHNTLIKRIFSYFFFNINHKIEYKQMFNGK